MLEYLRDSLLEGTRSDIASLDVQELSVEVSRDEIRRGQVHLEVLRQLSAKQRKDKPSLKIPDTLPVLISLAAYTKSARDILGPKEAHTFWLPARISPDGSLLPPSQGGPWIPRLHLEPMLGANNPTLGTLEDVSKFVKKYGANVPTDWKNYLHSAEHLFRFVSGEAPTALELEGYARQRNCFVMKDVSGHGSLRAMLKLIEEVLGGERSPGLLRSILSLKEPTRKVFPKNKAALARDSLRHLGVFGDSFPLGESQRLAVHRFLALPDEELLPVSGPPGTGKTTMIQSIVASLWVDAARRGKASPPVIAATGATNQSVMNVIDSFKRVAAAESIQRWLPKLDSFGSFLVSATKAKDLEGYQIERRTGEGLRNDLLNKDFVSSATLYYCKQAQAYFGKPLSLPKIVSRLRSEIQQEYGKLYRSIFFLKDGTLLDWLKSSLRLKPASSYAELFNGLAQFDTSSRYKLFELATHYWEGRWLLEAEKILRKERRRDETRYRGEREDFELRSMLTPVFVSTLSMLPRFFASRKNLTLPPIDVLIFDEAGQIPLDMGLACSVLAKKALVVGDCEQLEPMWNVSPLVDLSNLERIGLLKPKDEAAYQTLARRGLIASEKSLMYFALRTSRWIEETKNKESTFGVFLKEHRRSVPKIVAFSNELSYHNRLEPLRSEISDRVLPALGYVHVSGISLKQGQSRFNREEAHAILAWIEQNASVLKSYYPQTPIEDILAVITPFSAQSALLQRLLRPKFPKLTIGTVNSLQGAEKSVVIFSATYDQCFESTFFFDLGTNMLNVAVSRAKDSFILFGDMGIFDTEGTAPSSILARHLFAAPENAVGRIDVKSQQTFEQKELRRIASLEEHQEVLLDAFHSAKNEIIVCSPTISSRAITHDKLPEAIRQAVARGVSVKIFTDEELDQDRSEESRGGLKATAHEGRALLASAGAKVFTAKAIHNKALAIDEHTLIEGSFNWLSAVRKRRHPHQKFDVSWACQGEKAKREIQKLRDALEHRSLLAEP